MDIKSLIKASYGFLFQKQIEKNWKPGRLYVVNYHNTPKEHLPNFRQQLTYLAKHFEFISPNELDHLSTKNSEKPWMLFTFDDGIKSNLNIPPLLNEFGIKAIFFVVYEFIHAQDPLAFYRSNIRFEPHPDLEKTEEDMLPMSINELKELIAMGHTIGHHTATHDVREINNWSEEKLKYELLETRNLLKNELGVKVDYFASPIDTKYFISNREIFNKLKTIYSIHFTTFGFSNRIGFKNHMTLGRLNLEIHFRIRNILFCLSTFESQRWEKNRPG